MCHVPPIMDQSHQTILKNLRKSIVDDLDVYNGVINQLKTEYILGKEDEIYIGEGSSKEERAQRLLDVLPFRGPFAFHIFHQSLKHHYCWLSESMDKLLKSPATSASDNYQRINIPPISPLTVTREKEMNILKEALKKLEPQDWLVIHGMKGFGKASLTANTLQDQLFIQNRFQNQIYWIKFGYERPIADEILIQLNNLCHQIDANIPSTAKDCKETLKASLQSMINVHFKKNGNSQALLVLEDIFTKEIVDAFNFNCKKLIITNDLKVISDSHPIVVEMKEGFTEEETLGLFAKVLNTEVNKLPNEAKLIHRACKGMPLLIAMLSAQFEAFQQDMKIECRRWQYYLNCLRTKNTDNSVMKEFLKRQEVTFGMCIDQLPQKMKDRYQTLAIFSEDVNIMPKTLEILWDEKNIFHVEDLMLDFCHKSLAAKQWNDDLKSYIYGVHDLLLSYLRKVTDSEALCEMHRSFIDKCRKYAGGDFSKLPEDNYIYSYIGHHLEQAQLFDEFPKLYLDLNFLQSKIKNTGLSDLLIDLKKYRRHITNNNDPILLSKVEDLEHFLCHNTSVLAKQRSKQCLDLVQVGLNFSEDGYVNREARRLAEMRSKDEKKCYLSLERKKRPRRCSALSSEELPTSMPITMAHFTDNCDEILIGTGSGQIFLWNCTERNQNLIFSGHARTSGIKKIVLSKSGERFLTLSDSGIVKLYSLNQDCQFLEPRSPRQRQSNWSNIFQSSSELDNSLMTIAIDNDKISDVMFGKEDKTIVTCTYKGTLQIRNVERIILVKEHGDNCCLENIAFTNEYNLLHVLNTNNGVLIIYMLRGTDYEYVSQFNMQRKNMKVVFLKECSYLGESTLMIVTEKSVFIVSYFLLNDQLHSLETKNRIKINDRDHRIYTCATLTYDDEYLILADSAGNVTVWIASKCFEAFKIFKAHVSSLDTYYDAKGYHLICGSEGRVVHRWKLETQIEAPKKTQLVLHGIMKPNGEHDVIGKETISNTIEVTLDDTVLYESPKINGKIEKLYLCKDGNEIVYMTDKMSIVHINCATKTSTPVFQLVEVEDFITVMELDNRTTVICRERVNRNTENLKIWFSNGSIGLLHGVGHVISIRKLSDNIFMTANVDCLVSFYDIQKQDTKRQLINLSNHNIKTWLAANEIKLIGTCLSPDKRFLAIMHENKELSIFQVKVDEDSEPKNITINKVWTRTFQISAATNLHRAKFSQDGHYLAVGMDNGDIFILSTEDQLENATLLFHKAAIEQLHWAALSVGVPLLLSVNHEEMAVWNISLMNFRRSHSMRPSRMGPRRSISSPNIGSSPRSSFLMSSSTDGLDPNALTLQLAVENLSLVDPLVTTFWRSKVGKDPNRPELLAVIPISSTNATRVFVSKDFTKYLMSGENGFVNKYKLLGFP